MDLSGTLLLPGAKGRTVRLARGTVTLKDGRIAGVKEGDVESSAVIMPAFTDTHMHLPQWDIIGAHGRELLEWLTKVTFPAERKWEDAGYAEAMTHRAIDQLFAVGTTGICAYTSVHHESTMRAIAAVKQRKMRGRIGQTLMDREAPKYLVRPAEQLLEECRKALEEEMGDARVTTAVTPRFAISCSEELLRGCGELAKEYDAFVQTHLAETVDECRKVGKLFGMDYVSVYEKAGLLGAKAIHGHGIYVDAGDRERLAKSKTVIAHCPTANSFLMSGVMDRRDLMGAGVRIGLGSDIGGGYERSMVRVARAMIEAAAGLHRDVVSAAEAWWMITAGNAEIGGWSNAGKLVAGGDADVVVVEPDVEWEGAAEPLSALMFAWDDRWLRMTVAGGEVVYSAGSE